MRFNSKLATPSALFWIAFVNCYARRYYRGSVRLAEENQGRAANVALPVTVTEKFLWRKLFDRDPAMTAQSDKITARAIAQSIMPELKAPEILWIVDDPDQITSAMISGDIVVKANHGSGFQQIIRDGEVDIDQLRQRVRRWTETDYSSYFDEFNYHDIPRKIFAEKLLKDRDGNPVSTESKIMTFGGKAVFTFHYHDVLVEESKCMSLYGRDGKAVPYVSVEGVPVSMRDAPAEFDRMFQAAEVLAADRDHLRVDLYEMDGDIYFSEFTFFSLAGRISPIAAAAFPECASLWDLRKSWFLKTHQTGWRNAYARWLRSVLLGSETQRQKEGKS